jgi:DNA gyrase subunit A
LVGRETAEPAADAPPPVALEAQPVLVTVTAGAYLRAVPQRRTSAAYTGGRDPLVTALRTSVDATLLLVDADGDGNRVAVADLPVVTPRQRGVNLGQLTGMPPEAATAGAVVLGRDFVVTVSAAGLVKRSPREEYEGRTRAMVAVGVRPSDRIVAVAACDEEDHLLLAHDRGLVIRFPVAEVRPMGRAATGVAGMSVPRGGRIVALSVVPGAEEADAGVLTLARDGAAKRAPLADYPVQGRGGKGVQTGASPLAWCGLATDLHVPTELGWTLIRAELVQAGKRTGAGSSMTETVTGQVVPET